jgi:hypothetical protein
VGVVVVVVVVVIVVVVVVVVVVSTDGGWIVSLGLSPSTPERSLFSIFITIIIISIIIIIWASADLSSSKFECSDFPI